MLVVNKVDNVRMMDDIYEFYNLGMGDPIGISSVNLLNFGDLLEAAVRAIFPTPDEEDERDQARFRSPWRASPTWASRRWSTGCSARSA